MHNATNHDIKALILDFGGVLVTMPHDSPSAQRLAAQLGLEPAQLMDALLGSGDWNRALVGEISEIIHPRGGKLIVNADPAWLKGWPVDGVQLNSQRLAACEARPHFAWVGASCHSRAEQDRAAALGLDYALLGHVQATASHPGQAALGWDGLAACLAPAAPLPVFALGGLRAANLDAARQAGAAKMAIAVKPKDSRP